MKAITFCCEETLQSPPEEIAGHILDLSRWPEFRGYAVLPGIEAAEFEVKTPEIVGSRIRVANTDGSTHVEEIVEWQPRRRLRLHMHEFAAPLSRLAIGFDETWEFAPAGDSTRVRRSFDMHPRSPWTRPLLWLISFLLKKAVACHLREMRDSETI